MTKIEKIIVTILVTIVVGCCVIISTQQSPSEKLYLIEINK
jgi:uncharacterized protein YceK